MVKFLMIASLFLLSCASQKFDQISDIPLYGEIPDEVAVISSVIDVDTVEITTGEKIRLIGVDGPELNECYGTHGKNYLESLLLNKTIVLEMDSVNENADKYDRLLRYIKSNNENINLNIVQNGYAEFYNEYPSVYTDEFLKAENNAKINKYGLWGSCYEEASDAMIEFLNHSGSKEADEYVVIKNTGETGYLVNKHEVIVSSYQY